MKGSSWSFQSAVGEVGESSLADNLLSFSLFPLAALGDSVLPLFPLSVINPATPPNFVFPIVIVSLPPYNSPLLFTSSLVDPYLPSTEAGQNYLIYCSEGGQARVDEGKCLGIEQPIRKKSCSKIWSRLGLKAGSSTKMLEIRDLDCLEHLMWSGKPY